MDGRIQRIASLLAGLLIVFTLAVFATAFAHPTYAEEIASAAVEEKVIAPQEDAVISPTEMLVVFQEGTSDETIAETIQVADTADPSGEMVDGETGKLNSSYVLETPMDEVVVSVVIDEKTPFEEAAAEIAASDDVLYVQPNYIYSLNEYESEALEAEDLATSATAPEWYLGTINVPNAWSLLDANANVTSVAVLDTGCNMSHEDLQANVDRTHAATMNSSSVWTTGICSDSDTTSTGGHGTSVCGIVGATSTNDIGIMGVGGTHVRVIPVNAFWQTSSSKFTTDTATVVTAYKYLTGIARAQNLRVINMSIGGHEASDNDKAMHDAIAKALNDYGILTVASAGNKSTSKNSWPSDYDECISVTAIDSSGNRASYSDYNEAKDIAAPGSNIKSTKKDGSYGAFYGTSFAAPMVAGTLALIFAANPELTAEHARFILEDTATDIGDEGPDIYTGHGLVNAEAAVRAALATVPEPEPEPTPTPVDIPKAYTGLVYTGSSQTGVPSGTGYTLSGTYKATNAADAYTATAALNEGYVWSDGTSDAKTITWSIAKAKVDAPTARTDLVYTGSALTGVAETQGYTVAEGSATKAGSYTATVTLGANYMWSDGTTAQKTIKWTIGAAPLSNTTIEPIPDQYHTGSAVTPAVTVSYRSKSLAAGTDYKVSYANNVKAGNATVTLTGMGNFNGSATASFTILPPVLKNPFIDVDEDTPHFDEILWMYHAGVSTGWYDSATDTRTYRPYAKIARCDMAAFLYRLAGSPGYSPSPTDKARFSDVTSSTPHAKEIWWLAHVGISTGFSDGTFRPYASVARCDMAAFLYRLAGEPSYTPITDDMKRFSDIVSSTPHATEVLWLAHTGISTGFADGTFRPYASIVRCDMAAFLYRLDDRGLV